MTLAEGQTTPAHSHTHEKPQVGWQKDRKAILLLFVLYVIQALPQGLLFITIPVTLMGKGSTYNDLLIISLSYIPFCFKSFLSPLLNTYYIKSFGRGKTYLVPAQYITGLIMLFLAYKGEALFEKEAIPFLNVISIVTVLVLVLADVSLDGWMVNLISKENSSYGAVCQTIGFNLGFFLSFNIFLPLNSLEFCNNYIYSIPRKTPILEMSTYVSTLGIGILLATMWIHFFLVEKEPDHHGSASVTEVIKTLKIFITNSEFRKLLFVFATWNIVFGPIHNLFPGLIMERGVTKELFTNLNTPITPMIFIITIWLGSLCKKYPETKVANTFWILRLLSTFLLYGTIVYLKHIPELLKVPVLFLASLSGSITFNGIAVALGSFANRVSKETYGGVIMSTFGAIGCVSRLIGDTYVFGVTHLIGWDKFAIFTLFAMFAYAAVFTKTLKSFENKDLKTLVDGKVKHE